MHRSQKMQMKDDGQLGLQVQIHLEIDRTGNLTNQNPRAEASIMSKGGPAISEMNGLPEVPATYLVTHRGMIFMTLATVSRVLEVIFLDLEALVWEDPFLTEIEGAL